jgi:hypothetical protein
LKENCRVIVSSLADAHEEGELLICLQATADSRCFGESLSGDSTTRVSENSEGRLTVRPFGSATIVPPETHAEKASPSLVWAKSQQGLKLVLLNLDSREEVNCSYRIIGEGDFCRKSSYYIFSFQVAFHRTC